MVGGTDRVLLEAVVQRNIRLLLSVVCFRQWKLLLPHFCFSRRLAPSRPGAPELEALWRALQGGPHFLPTEGFPMCMQLHQAIHFSIQSSTSFLKGASWSFSPVNINLPGLPVLSHLSALLRLFHYFPWEFWREKSGSGACHLKWDIKDFQW